MHKRNKTQRRSVRILAVAGAGMVCILLTSCAPNIPMPVPSATASATPPPKGDGVLTFGTLFPTTGASAMASRAQVAGVELAVREINEAGGVNGQHVIVYHEDSGSASTAKAKESFSALMSRGVDVLIGPSLPELAKRLLPMAMDAGIAMISPTITSPALTTFKDDGFLFRTIPSEALEGKALASIFGRDRVAVIYQSIDPDRAVRDELVAELETVGGELVAYEGYSAANDDVEGIVSVLSAAKPDVVVLTSPATAMEKNVAFIVALSEANLAGSKLWLTSRNLVDYSKDLPEGTLEGVNGILAGAEIDAGFQKRVASADPTVTDFRFAAEAYDATILAALAALAAADDSGHSVAKALQVMSQPGIACTSFGECVDVLRSRPDIEYDGIAGRHSFDAHGDPRFGSYGIYQYAADGSFALEDTVKVE